MVNAPDDSLRAQQEVVAYRCSDCSEKVTLQTTATVRCRACGSRILYKMRTRRGNQPYILTHISLSHPILRKMINNPIFLHLAHHRTTHLIMNKHKYRVSKEVSRIRHIKDLRPCEDIYELITRLKLFAQEYRQTATDSYWSRKSNKTVLAVIMYKAPDGNNAFSRGINLELSLPSGSLCAERAAIASALSQNLAISRKDFTALAVVCPNSDASNPISPCGVCYEWIKKIEEEAPYFVVVTFSSTQMDHIFERFSVNVIEDIEISPYAIQPARHCETESTDTSLNAI